jgi:hypothetical protein
LSHKEMIITINYREVGSIKPLGGMG